MSTWQLAIGEVACTASSAESVLELPIGLAALMQRVLVTDPPRPEELTNAIGEVIDHLDDLLRVWPDALEADWVLTGLDAVAIAGVEVGHEPVLPVTLPRGAVEEVFRTMATEAAADRCLNPGLPRQQVRSIVAGCCVAVAIMRRLHLETITIDLLMTDHEVRT